MSLKTIISIAGGAIGVGGIVTPVALWQTGYLGTTSQNSNSNTESTSASQSVSTSTSSGARSLSEGNCEVVNTIGEDIFSGLGINKSNYKTISCEKTDSEDSERKFAGNWKGLFPNDLLISEGESFTKGMKFHLETKTVTADDDEEDQEYVTTFTGNRFLNSSSLTGKWGSQDKDISGKLITEITVEDVSVGSQKIYLLLSSRN